MKISYFTKILCFWSALASLAANNSTSGHAVEPIYLTLKFDKNQTIVSPAFIYVGGKIVGAMPGTVEIQSAVPDTSVEIGSPQLETPLYSFVLGEKQIASLTANVVMTNIAFRNTKRTDFWSSLNVEPNSSSQVSIRPMGSNEYEISLPANSYQSFEGVSRAWGMKPYDKDWFGTIPSENYAALSIPHVTYDRSIAAISMLNPDGSSSWAGAYDETTKVSFGLNLQTERWSVKSIPLGATILTDQGKMGFTNTEIEITKTGSSFMILQLAGYVDCPKEKCKQGQKMGQNELECRLKKYK